MSIEAKNSNSVYAECPKCHSTITHGFQMCSNCGHMVSASEQVELRRGLRNNVIKFFTTSGLVVSLVGGLVYLCK